MFNLSVAPTIMADNKDLQQKAGLDAVENDIFDALLTIDSPVNLGVATTYDTENLSSKSEAKIIALNKVTSMSKELTIPVGGGQYFGNIEVRVLRCAKNLDPYSPDSLVLTSIREHDIDDDVRNIFTGWMISSSISLSGFEHPIYEIFLKECL
jgi:hypothetical protein